MRSRSLAAFLGLLLSSSALALAAEAASLEGAVQKLGAAKTVALEFSGSGQWFQFGQAPVPGGPWPQFDLSRYEADAYSPLAADAPLPKTANPYAVNLLENIERNKLDVERIAGLHGARVASLDDLKAFVGQKQAAR